MEDSHLNAQGWGCEVLCAVDPRAEAVEEWKSLEASLAEIGNPDAALHDRLHESGTFVIAHGADLCPRHGGGRRAGRRRQGPLEATA